jgi:hypothetical protein
MRVDNSDAPLDTSDSVLLNEMREIRQDLRATLGFISCDRGLLIK